MLMDFKVNTISNSGACVVKCEHPTIILHPYAKSFFYRYANFCYNSVLYNSYDPRCVRVRSFDVFYKSFVSPFFKNYKVRPDCTFDYDSLLSQYHFIDNDGNCLPMFLMVPCGKCSVCANTRLNDIAARCQLESYTSKCAPLFVTLTYDNEHLPLDKSVSVKEMQDFMKRLRINFNRFFGRHIPLRYIYCGEYCPTSGRPHYHLMIWNVPYFPNGLSPEQIKFCDGKFDGYPVQKQRFADINAFFDSPRCPLRGSLTCDLGRIRGYDILKKLIWFSWHKGFIKAEVSRDLSGRYIAKYIGKGTNAPRGCADGFVRWSTRRGLGFDAFDKEFRELLLANPNLTQISFFDVKSNQHYKVPIPKYYRTLLAPSLSVVSKPFRVNLESICYCYNSLKYLHKCGVIFDFNPIKSNYKDVLVKYELFLDLAQMCVNPLTPCEKSDLFRLASSLKSCFNSDASDYFNSLCDLFRDLFSSLMSFDLDSIHLQNILDYKYLSNIARVNYAKSHVVTLQSVINKARDCFSRLRAKEYQNII